MFDKIHLTASSPNALYTTLLQTLLVSGVETSPRRLATREILNLGLTITDPLHSVITIPERNLNYHFMAAESLWILSGSDDAAMIGAYNSQMLKFSDDGVTFWGAYGPRFREQLDHVLSTLRRDPHSRQAVITLWRQNPPQTRDVPCTLAWQFLIRGGSLHLIATMRSSDAWLGIPYDIYTFCSVQRLVAVALSLPLGAFHLNLGSSHLYEPDFEKALRLVDSWARGVECPPIPALPLRHPIHPDLLVAEEEVRQLKTTSSFSQLQDIWVPWAEVLAHRFLRDDARLLKSCPHPFARFLATKEW